MEEEEAAEPEPEPEVVEEEELEEVVGVAMVKAVVLMWVTSRRPLGWR